jgi:hypothetical protein
MPHGPIPDLLVPPRRSKRECWADYYLLEPAVTIFETPEKRAAYWRIRRELQAEIERHGYVREEGKS